MKISDIMTEAHETALEKGWYDPPKTLGEAVLLVHTELSEAVEELRKDVPIDSIYFLSDKPEGFGVELADAIIRICDIAQYHSIDLEDAIRLKLEYNKTRPRRHGGKKL
jgi:NTP pyrophosphatase (non-canonical NTP hydrolase)